MDQAAKHTFDLVTKREFGLSSDMKGIKNIKALCIALAMALAFTMVNDAQAQCDLKIESKVIVPEGSSTGAIYLKVEKGTGSIDFYLVDLSEPQKGTLIKETRSASDLKKDFVLIFDNLKPSTYTIQAIQSRECQVSVGGVGGITVSKK